MNKINNFFKPVSKKRKAEDEGTSSSENCNGSKSEEINKISKFFKPVSKDRKTEDEKSVSKNCTGNDGKELCDEQKNKNSKEWPDCWTVQQKDDFCQKNEWLYVKNKMLGCKVCQCVGSLGVEKQMGVKISTEWANGHISYFGETHNKQLMSLRKKIFDHKESAAHRTAQKINAEAKKETLEKVCLKSLSREKEITAKVFRTAYKVAKKNQAFNNFEEEINLQELNGTDMGRILHSTNACINIINHIGNEMRKTLVRQIVNSKAKISLIIDESTTVSHKSTLIVYCRVFLPEWDSASFPVNIFLDLIELSNVTAKGIFSSLLSRLELLGISEDYLRGHLISVTCDGAAVMFGVRNGVRQLFKEIFQGLIVWHCANHRLELAVHDAANSAAGINRFKNFMDKLYVTYHASPKNARELQMHANALEIQLLKIGRILNTRWVASSFRTVSAVWQDYEALVLHFRQAQEDGRRSKTDRSLYEGLLKKITSSAFVLDLGLMCDALQELSELSLDLQGRHINLYNADKKIRNLIQVFSERTKFPGPYYEQSLSSEKTLNFKGVELHTSNKHNPAINPVSFYRHLKESLEKRLMDGEDADLISSVKILDSKYWPEKLERHLTFGEVEIRKLAQKFSLNERNAIQGFREYLLDSTIISDKLLPLMHTLSTIAISSSECERGFSRMNLILTPARSSLRIQTTSALMFIKIVGPPLIKFDPTKYVETWLLKGHHSAVDTNSKERSREDDGASEDISRIWELL